MRSAWLIYRAAGMRISRKCCKFENSPGNSEIVSGVSKSARRSVENMMESLFPDRFVAQKSGSLPSGSRAATTRLWYAS